MKKLLLASLLCLTALPSLAHDRCHDRCRWLDGFSFVVKNGYFIPQSDVLRDIFHKGGHGSGGYWVEGDLRYNFWDCFVLEASGSYFQRHGKALISPKCVTLEQPLCDEKTKVQIPTFGLGLKYFWSFINGDCHRWLTDASLFIGGGMRVFFYREFDDSPYVPKHVKKNTVGGMVDGGIQMTLCDRWLIELSLDYNIKKLEFKCTNSCKDSCCKNDKCSKLDCCITPTLPNTCCPSARCNLNIGGAVIGLGLGYQF